MRHGLASVNPKANARLSKGFNNQVGKGLAQMMKGQMMQDSKIQSKSLWKNVRC